MKINRKCVGFKIFRIHDEKRMKHHDKKQGETFICQLSFIFLQKGESKWIRFDGEKILVFFRFFFVKPIRSFFKVLPYRFFIDFMAQRGIFRY